MSDLPERTLLYPKEVKAFLRVSKNTVYRLIDEGQIPAIKIRNVLRIPRKEFLEWYEKHPSVLDTASLLSL